MIRFAPVFAATIVFCVCACARANSDHDPARLSGCTVEATPFATGYVVRYAMRLRSESAKSIVATRIVMQPWRRAERPLRGIRSGFVYDDEKRLAPFASHEVWLRTSVLQGPKPLRSRVPLSCEVAGVMYADGSSWTVAPGVAGPPLSEHASRNFRDATPAP